MAASDWYAQRQGARLAVIVITALVLAVAVCLLVAWQVRRHQNLLWTISEARFRLLDRVISQSSNGVVITDIQEADQPVMFVNAAFTRITGYAAEEAIDGLRLDIVSDRLSGDRVDLVVATNIFPYLNDVELTLALANIAAILAPGGLLLHNEARPLVGDITNELELPLTHSRMATLATVRGSTTPLYDRVFIHVKGPRR